MRPAERLRQAARLARETAEAATPGPWEVYEGHSKTFVESTIEEDASGNPVPVSQTINNPADATHQALWSPLVASPVAAWLERTADRMDAWATKFSGALWRQDGRLMPSTYAGFFEAEDWQLALAVADALLQTQPVKP